MYSIKELLSYCVLLSTISFGIILGEIVGDCDRFDCRTVREISGISSSYYILFGILVSYFWKTFGPELPYFSFSILDISLPSDELPGNYKLHVCFFSVICSVVPGTFKLLLSLVLNLL